MSCEQARNLGWLEALHPEEMAPTAKGVWKEALNTGQPIDIVHRVKTANGKVEMVRARGSPSYGPSGKMDVVRPRMRGQSTS